MLLAAEVNKKRKKDKNSPGLNDADAKRQVTVMSQKNQVVQKPSKDKGKSQDSSGQCQASSSYILPASFPYQQQQYPTQFNTPNPHFVQNPGSPVLQNPTHQPQMSSFNNDLYAKIDFIMSKVSLMDSIDQKMSKLDNIETQQERILSRLNKIESSVSVNKKSIDNAMKKLSDIEQSQTFLSSEYDKLSDTVDRNKSCVTKLQGEVKTLTEENTKLKSKNSSIINDVIDLKCRSMRDNMIFMGIEEQAYTPFMRRSESSHDSPFGPVNSATGGAAAMDVAHSTDVEADPNLTGSTYAQTLKTPSQPFNHNAPEDCASKVYKLCESVLKISDVRNKIYIDRAHRIGDRSHGKARPIVAKFLNTRSKLEVKAALKNVNLKDTQYAIFDQHPKEVGDRRKELIPIMVQARKDNKKAYLVRDKLYINNKLYDPKSTD